MNQSALGWLIRDVFLRAKASGLLAAVAGAIALATAVSATARYDADAQALTLLFGTCSIPGPTAESAVRQYLFLLSFGIGDVLGVVLILIATAGFLPEFFDPSVAAVLVAKPVGRTRLLVGRFAGVVLSVLLFATMFSLATLTATGLATGIWAPAYLLAPALLAVQFFAFFAGASLVAVSTRSTAATMLGGVLFWLVSWGMSFGRHLLVATKLEEADARFGRVVEWAYQVLPRPADFSLMLHSALGIAPEGLAGVGLRQVQEQWLFNPFAAVAGCLVVGVALLSLTAYELNHQDY